MTRGILLIEDDEELGAQLVKHLQAAGLSTRWLKDGRVLVADDLSDVQLIVLDLMLPSLHGAEPAYIAPRSRWLT